MTFTTPNFQIRDFAEDHLFNFGEKTAKLLGVFPTGDLMGLYAHALAELNEELGRRIGRLPTNPFVADKAQADKKRDGLKIRIYELTRIAAEDPESEAVRAAAAVIQEVLDRRPAGFQNLIHEQNTTQLQQLLADLAEPSVKKAAETAGLTKWIHALAASETDFEAADHRYDEFQRKSVKPRLLADIRRDYNETLRLILDGLAWAANRQGSESQYAEAFRGLRGELVALSSLAKLRDTADAKREKKAAGKKAELTS